jgi:hypothetical protein
VVEVNLTAPIRLSKEARLFTPKTVQYLISHAAHLEKTKSPNALHRELRRTDSDGRSAVRSRWPDVQKRFAWFMIQSKRSVFFE